MAGKTDATEERTLLTAKQAAERLGVSHHTVYRLARQKKLAHYKLFGAGMRFDAADIEAALAATYHPAA